MTTKRPCKVEGCAEPRLKGAFLCETHIGEKRRCEGRVQETDPETGEVLGERQCKKSARPGLLVCEKHGGYGKRSVEVSHRTQALNAMQRFVQPFQGDLDPVSAFELEFRRTYGRILWLEEQIAQLSEEDLIWGLTKEEHVNAGEFPGTNRTYEARIHVYEKMLWDERKHYHAMMKTWIAAKLDERKLNIMRDHITYTYNKVVEAAKALGHDPADPVVRERLLRLFTGGEDHAAIEA